MKNNYKLENNAEIILQNFADAGKALYRVARKYASKVKKAVKLLQISINAATIAHYFSLKLLIV